MENPLSPESYRGFLMQHRFGSDGTKIVITS
nr:MAG TPA: SMI1-KNR4 cell-wall [Bacteriophage sp.]